MERGEGHRPVLREAVAELLAPAGTCRPAAGERTEPVLVDATVGLGGHAEALLTVAGPEARLIGIDLDEANLARAKRRLAAFGERVRLFRANFADVSEVLSEADASDADALIADLGVASSQLDDPARGFSFLRDGPLDMRLGAPAAGERTAAELVNSLDERALADLIYEYGEERYSRRIARAIAAARKRKRIERTTELAEIVSRAYPAPARRSRRGVHPATRTFQALRIAVNDELASLDRLLAALPGVLAVGGRAGIISFHSLEDRRVKRTFRAWEAGGAARVLTKKPITPAPDEAAANPRSRSAKLRGIERIRQDEARGGAPG